VGGQRHAPAALPPGKRPGTHCIGGWVGPRAGLGGCGKSRSPPGFDPRTIHPVASRYTDYAIPVNPCIRCIYYYYYYYYYSRCLLYAGYLPLHS
jgi:hypothetical protein